MINNGMWKHTFVSTKHSPTQTDFVGFFTNLYQRRLHLLENMEQSESKECEQLIELIASESNRSPTRKAALVEEKKQLDVLLSHMNIMLRRVRLVVKAGNEFLQHPLSKAGLGEMTTEEARVPGEEASQRIGRINAMLSNRIYKRNQILPLAHQVCTCAQWSIHFSKSLTPPLRPTTDWVSKCVFAKYH